MESSVEVITKRINSETQIIRTKRVFLGCGALNSSVLVLKALKKQAATFRIKDSQYFIIPALSRFQGPTLADGKHHALSQFFLQILKSEVSKHPVHIQAYGYSEYIHDAVTSKFGFMGPLVGKIFRPFLTRLVMLQGFLHSDESEEIQVNFINGSTASLDLEVISNPETRKIIKRVSRHLLKTSYIHSLLPISLLTEITQPGRSFHYGGSFPMSKEKGNFRSDLLGRPDSLQRIHLIDASIFPSIPGTTITFTAMANAYRIGMKASQEFSSSSI
jgi:hypothetical protein